MNLPPVKRLSCGLTRAREFSDQLIGIAFEFSSLVTELTRCEDMRVLAEMIEYTEEFTRSVKQAKDTLGLRVETAGKKVRQHDAIYN